MKRNILAAAGVFVLIAVLLVVFGTEQAAAPENKEYESKVLGVSFTRPSKLAVSEAEGKVVLKHTVPFQNAGCDMSGETMKPELDDFKLTLEVMPHGVAESMKMVSPYIPAENFNGDEVIVSPGFIDKVKIGNLDGWTIFEGAEGCGHVIYYFPITPQKTLVATHDLVFEFSGVVVEERKNALLAVPGVITPAEAELLRNEVFGSIRVK